MVSFPASRHDRCGEYHALCCGLVALAERSTRVYLVLLALVLLADFRVSCCSISIASMTKDTLFALSLFPYLGFLWFLTRSRQAPSLALWGFYLLLVFVAVTIPAGLYTQRVLGQSLANVDPIHGGAEFFLTLSNVFVVLGFQQAIQGKQHAATQDLQDLDRKNQL
jgi:hypothetical protein